MPVKRKNTQDGHEHVVKRRCRAFNPEVPPPGNPPSGAPFVRRVLRAFSRAPRLTVKIKAVPSTVFFRETPVNYYCNRTDQAPLVLDSAPLSPEDAPLSPDNAPLSPEDAPLSPVQAPISPARALVSPVRAPGYSSWELERLQQRGREGRAKRKANFAREREEKLFKALHEEIEYAGRTYKGIQEIRKAVRMAEDDAEKGLSALNWLRGCNKMDFPTLVWVAGVEEGAVEQTKEIQRSIVEGAEKKVDKLSRVISQGLEALSKVHKKEAEELNQREAAIEATLEATEQLMRQERAQLELEKQALQEERAQLDADKKALNDEREQALKTVAQHTQEIEDKIRAEYAALQNDLRRNARLKQHMELPELKKTAEALAEPMTPVTKLRFDRAVEQMSRRCVREVQDGLNELTMVYEEKIKALTEMYEGERR